MPARDVFDDRGDGEIWIDHAKISADDFQWLQAAQRLTLWNVTVPDGFLRRIPSLWWLDLRGGSAVDLKVAQGCQRLRYLAINQVRGMVDLGLLSSFKSLELLTLYGLPQVEELPSLRPLSQLRRAEVGQMKGLASIGKILDAPSLEELLMSKRVGTIDADVERIMKHKKLSQFLWYTEDVPRKISDPVLARIDKPKARSMHAIDWFQQ